MVPWMNDVGVVEVLKRLLLYGECLLSFVHNRLRCSHMSVIRQGYTRVTAPNVIPEQVVSLSNAMV